MPLRPFRLFLPPNYPSATPTFDVSREWNTGNIGIVSKCLGLNAGFRKKIIQLFDLGYASRLRLIFCISAGFVLCHIFISYVPTVEIIVEADGEQDDDEDEEDDEQESDEEEEETEADVAGEAYEEVESNSTEVSESQEKSTEESPCSSSTTEAKNTEEELKEESLPNDKQCNPS